MEIDIYKVDTNNRRQRVYVLVRVGRSINLLPLDVRQGLENVEFFRTISFVEGDKRVGIDVNKTISDIKTKGYHICVMQI